MTLSKRLSFPCVLMILVLCTGFACNTAQQQQAAQAANNASIIVKGFQQGEILAFQQGQIPVEDHLFIQRALASVAEVGKTTDTCIRSAGNNKLVVECVNNAVANLDRLTEQGKMFLKSDKAKTDFVLAMIGTRTALAVIVTILGGA